MTFARKALAGSIPIGMAATLSRFEDWPKGTWIPGQGIEGPEPTSLTASPTAYAICPSRYGKAERPVESLWQNLAHDSSARIVLSRTPPPIGNEDAGAVKPAGTDQSPETHIER